MTWQQLSTELCKTYWLCCIEGYQNNPAIPIVFLPSHRSYFDFFIDLFAVFRPTNTTPAIAAGEDFKSSKLLGEALRRCEHGLSNAVLVMMISTGQYFQNMCRLIYQRSRTMKSLTPKTGLLQTTLEPFFRGEVYDIALVPVTINYEKLLEESLYAWELFGFAKPKETTSGLFKAREILSKNFGNVYCTFGEFISVRQQFSSGKITADEFRLQLSCKPVADFSLPD
uniref:Phospholipid/glycerol acyltransferase domain-containing protein n=1 Tax=Ditylenchus dipsaci TaxID=166011 RepID=A0A915EMD1_9BILA